MSAYWNLDQAPDQTGRIAVVTGANIGLGYETALALAGKRATVVLACRNQDKAETARQNINRQYPGAQIVVMTIDTGSLPSVHEFARQFLAQFNRCDLLINNAGIMMPPYSLTADGFESQFAVNYLGHFLLTGLLLPLIQQTAGARIVTLSSLAHRWGSIQFDDINFSQGYDRRKAYGQSKAACLMFAIELQRRLKSAGHATLSLAAHPGFSYTQLGRNLPKLFQLIFPLIGPLLSQSAAAGALPTLYAALGDNLSGGEYTGPAGKNEHKGPPTVVPYEPWIDDLEAGRKLWQLSEKMTGIQYLDPPY